MCFTCGFTGSPAKATACFATQSIWGGCFRCSDVYRQWIPSLWLVTTDEWFCNCHHLDFNIYGTEEQSVITCNISESENRSVDPPCDANLFQNWMGYFLSHATPFHQASCKSSWWILCNPAYRQTDGVLVKIDQSFGYKCFLKANWTIPTKCIHVTTKLYSFIHSFINGHKTWHAKK